MLRVLSAGAEGIGVFFLLLLSMASPLNAESFNVTLGKGMVFRQTDADSVRPAAVNPYRFSAAIYPLEPDLLDRAAVRIPSGQWLYLTPPADTRWPFFLNRNFASREALDAAFPDGRYTLSPQHTPLRLLSSNYPNTPRISNWEAAQDIDTTLDFPLKWDPFSGHDDFISNNDTIYLDLTPMPEPAYPRGAMEPWLTRAIIPAGSLAPNQTVSGSLIFFRKRGWTSSEFLFGYSGPYRETRFTIRGGAPPPPQGRIQFSPDFHDQATGQISPDDAWDVLEGTQIANLLVTRTGGDDSLPAAGFTVTTQDGGAVAGRDYVGLIQTIVSYLRQSRRLEIA